MFGTFTMESYRIYMDIGKNVDISNTESGGKLALRVIHPKSGIPGSPDSANNFDFPQRYCLGMRKFALLNFVRKSNSFKDVSKYCEEMPYMSYKHFLGLQHCTKMLLINPHSCKS